MTELRQHHINVGGAINTVELNSLEKREKILLVQNIDEPEDS